MKVGKITHINKCRQYDTTSGIKTQNTGDRIMGEYERQANEGMWRNNVLKKLDEIIELLRPHNSIEVVSAGVDGWREMPCTCHEKGKTSAVVTCPLHG